MIAATQCARAVAAPMGRTATVRVSTLVQTFAGYCAPRACEITTMSPCITFAVASQSFRKTMAVELSGGGTEVSSVIIGRAFALALPASVLTRR